MHATGRARVVSDAKGIERILKKSVDQFESGSRQPWRYELPEEFKEKLIAGVIGFEITVTKIEGKFKLSQNRSAQDRAGVERGLSVRTDEMSQKVLELMRKSLLG